MKLTKNQKELKKSLDKNVKMMFLIRTDLKMSKGKIAAQCSHAAINMYKDLIKMNNQYLEDWEKTGTKKITLKCKNQKELHDFRVKCEKNELPYTIIKDAGKTQVQAGSETVLALFGESKKLDQLTGQLKLMD